MSTCRQTSFYDPVKMTELDRSRALVQVLMQNLYENGHTSHQRQKLERPAPRSILKSGKTAERTSQPRNHMWFNLPPSLSSFTEQHTLSEGSSPELLTRMAQTVAKLFTCNTNQRTI
ncbi:hypothetical protein OSTOST_24359 [Ostertagia ostertagi]